MNRGDINFVSMFESSSTSREDCIQLPTCSDQFSPADSAQEQKTRCRNKTLRTPEFHHMTNRQFSSLLLRKNIESTFGKKLDITSSSDKLLLENCRPRYIPYHFPAFLFLKVTF